MLMLKTLSSSSCKKGACAMTTQLTEGLTLREFARLNRISEATASRLVNSGQIPSYKVGSSRRIRADVAAEIQRGDRTAFIDSDTDEMIRQLVDAAPEFSDVQIERIRALLHSADADALA